MTRNEFIANRLREVFLNGQWIANTNYKHQLENVTLEQATQKIGTLNTIAALTYHINYYLEGLSNVLEGGNLEIKDKYSFDLPSLQSEDDWNLLVTTLLHNAEKFANQVELLADEKFDQPFVEEKYGTYLRNMEGVIEHSYYHLGQIALLKKMISTSF